jgi:hypothetical protein
METILVNLNGSYQDPDLAGVPEMDREERFYRGAIQQPEQKGIQPRQSPVQNDYATQKSSATQKGGYGAVQKGYAPQQARYRQFGFDRY